jgi:gliding motility-associated-like protein
MNKNYTKKLHYVFFTILLSVIAQITFGQSFYNTTNWRFSNPKQFGFFISDIDFVDNNKGIAVGGNSGIAYTSDGGATWKYGAFTFIGTTNVEIGCAFQDVHFASANVAYAVGTNGCMAKTTDAGATWSLIKSPLYANVKNINTVWFLNENKGYIAGQFNTPDSLPKLYVTNNGGSTWDSISAPIGGRTKFGYINNPNLAPINANITAKGKEIYRIKFLGTTAYITGGSSSGSGNFFPNHPAINTTTCLPNGTFTTSSAGDASLVWKMTNEVLTDYSVSKERLGYSGIYVPAPVPCTARYGSNGVHTNNFKALHIENDSTIILISFNNNIIVRINTGKNDSTANINFPGVFEKGRYTLLNAPNPPVNNVTTSGPSIPAVNPAFGFSNPLEILKAPNGKLLVPVLSATFFPENTLQTSTNGGATWVRERFLPTGRNYSEFGGQAIDLLPSGKYVVGGTGGVLSDSIAGGVWQSTYKMDAVGNFNKIDFADCANGMAVGGGFIATTNNTGRTWSELRRTDLISINAQINSGAYINNNPARAYFATSIGNIYKTLDLTAANPTLDPVYSNLNEQIQDIATMGPDTAWACGQSGFSVLSASRSPKVFRTVDNGATWTVFNGFNVGTLSQRFTCIEFPSRNIGYVTGSRDTIWKTSNAGTTWTKLPLPFPGVTPQITYNDMFALNDNTVFAVGVGFPRKVIIRTTDGGNTWQDITGNALAIFPVGNFNSVVFHDLNNGYVGCAGGFLVTNNGGTTWRIDQVPSASNHVSMAFAPKQVPTGTPVARRKLFTVTVFGNNILEYGKQADVDVNSTENITASCAVGTQGSITVTATGGLGVYSYSLNGGTFQASNVFNNVAAGNNTIVVRDAFCGIITKTINVPARPTPAVDAGPDQVAVDGDVVVLNGSGAANTTNIAWSPIASIVNGATNFLATAKPRTTTTYSLTITDANGCIAKDSATISVFANCLKTMDAFTPNGDGQNDRWLATSSNACVKKITVAVYNRYGTLVYKNDNYTNNWDGTYNGKPVPDGTYYYVNSYTLVTGASAVLKGDVTILR